MALDDREENDPLVGAFAISGIRRYTSGGARIKDVDDKISCKYHPCNRNCRVTSRTEALKPVA